MSETQKRVQETLLRELGPDVRQWLYDKTVIEIMLNPDGFLWVERLGQRMEKSRRMDAWQSESLIKTIASVMNKQVTDQNPLLECELPIDGSRFSAVMPPVVAAPMFTIRKKAIAVFSMQDYVEQGIMSQSQREIIEEAVRTRQNIVIVGGTGSGKTTLTNAVVRYIADACPDDRLLIMEDTRELQCEAENVAVMQSTPYTNMMVLTKTFMRHRPDRILVGEVRDGAALDMLNCWNTGHPGGVTTLHANDAIAGLLRLERLVLQATQGNVRPMIAESVNLIVFIEKHNSSRRIKEIVRVLGYDGEQYQTELMGGDDDENWFA